MMEVELFIPLTREALIQSWLLGCRKRGGILANFIVRYLQGEYQEVWDELLLQGSSVKQEPLFSDAMAVARETMRRVKQNIEILIPRLVSIGYRFGYDHLLQPSERQVIASIKGQRYLDKWQWAREQPPLYISAHLYAEEIKDLQMILTREAPSSEFNAILRQRIDDLQAQPTMLRNCNHD